jgi:hypothetical protein
LSEDFTPLKLYGKWSKGLSLTYLMIADFRDVNQSKNMREKIAQQVHLKWEDIYNQGSFIFSQFFLLMMSPLPSTFVRSMSKRSILMLDGLSQPTRPSYLKQRMNAAPNKPAT